MTRVRLTRWAYDLLLQRAAYDAEDVVNLIWEAAAINDMPHIKGVTVIDTQLGHPLVDFLAMKDDGNIIFDVRMRYSHEGLAYTLGSSSVCIHGMPRALGLSYVGKVPFPIEGLIEGHPYQGISGAIVQKVEQLNLVTIFSTDRSCKNDLVDDYPDSAEGWEEAVRKENP